MDIQSEYYHTWEENMEKYGIDAEDTAFAESVFQGLEDQMFGFAMFMLM